MTQPAGVSSFIDKWRARWPEWTLAMVFVPAAQRERVAAWFALLQELTDAAWAEGDPAPGLAKLAWWQEELQGWAKGARRHPLGDVLQPCSAPWAALAGTLPALRASRAPGDPRIAIDMASPAFARAVADCEAALFGPPDARDATPLVAASLAVEHALSRTETDAAPVALPRAPGAPRVRRMQAALAFARLRRKGRALPPWRALFVAWRAARA